MHLCRFFFSENRKSVKVFLFNFAVKNIPFAKRKLQNDMNRIEQETMESLDKNTDKKQSTLLKKGMKPSNLEKRKEEWIKRDELISGTGQVSGSRYCFDPEYESELKEFSSNKKKNLYSIYK